MSSEGRWHGRRLHFVGIVCVLFDVQDEAHYQEWLRGIRDPDVVVIRID